MSTRLMKPGEATLVLLLLSGIARSFAVRTWMDLQILCFKTPSGN